MYSYPTKMIHFPSYKTLELFRHNDTSNRKSNEILLNEEEKLEEFIK